ncbi:hypothetical protein M0638_25410 [Roseomonas sp. NAR14]|uniref:Uncharacterized protein n=1 Tax=Roseomonas acroporae TaxID=2937791 RepID=A0A9X2BWI0_9PROT|nr:hypothetical protein [Roseomonas acroporae]MCK8787707.1 hypothetical protein [Roseomonas acroporae]
MRAFSGQFSDAKPIQRSREEKKRQLADLRQALATMKAHAAPALRASLAAKIAALEGELQGGQKGGTTRA